MKATRVALVTGASGALGSATAAAFHAEGWRVIGVDRREPLSPTGCVDFVVVDLSEPNAAESARAQVAMLGQLDALVNNASVQLNRSLVDTTDGDWRDIMATNLDAAFRLTRAMAPMLSKARGSIVNVSSVHAVASSRNVAAYAISKAAIVGLTRSTALELGPAGVRCNAVLPGAIRSPMLDGGLARRSHPGGAAGNLADLTARTPLGFVAEPHQVAPSIVFLADGERSSYTTGQLLIVDGGATARLGTE